MPVSDPRFVGQFDADLLIRLGKLLKTIDESGMPIRHAKVTVGDEAVEIQCAAIHYHPDGFHYVDIVGEQ